MLHVVPERTNTFTSILSDKKAQADRKKNAQILAERKLAVIVDVTDELSSSEDESEISHVKVPVASVAVPTAVPIASLIPEPSKRSRKPSNTQKKKPKAQLVVRGGRTMPTPIPVPHASKAVGCDDYLSSLARSNVEMKPSKKRRFRQNTVILRDMKKQQKMAHLKHSIPRNAIKLLMQDACINACPNGLRIQAKAIDVIHEGVETYLIDTFQQALSILVASKNKKLMKRHWVALNELKLTPTPK